jgi:HD superfamily phosphohydrolase YqeK
VNYNILLKIKEIETKCKEECDFSMGKIHGLNHFRQVAYIAGRIALTNMAPLEDSIIGGFLHDCAREDNHGGNEHAQESAKLARDIIINHWPDVDVERICDAIYYHADGLVTKDPIGGCIWDADRISLARLGISPKNELLSTPIAKRFNKMVLKQNKILNELKRHSSLIINNISENGEAYLGIWCGELSMFYLTHIMILIEKVLREDLSKLKIVSLYDYVGLPNTHDQSTCYQIYKECYHFGAFSHAQILCPLHDSFTSSLLEKSLCCIIPFEAPLSPSLASQNIIDENTFHTIKMDSMVQNYRSRFFERFNKTPTYIYSVPFEKIKNMRNKTVLIDSQIKHYYRHILKEHVELDKLTIDLFKNSNIFKLSTYPIGY